MASRKGPNHLICRVSFGAATLLALDVEFRVCVTGARGGTFSSTPGSKASKYSKDVDSESAPFTKEKHPFCFGALNVSCSLLEKTKRGRGRERERGE